MRIAAALLLVARAIAEASLRSVCAHDEDCFLNGVCASGACACDPGWTAASNCALLALAPVDPAEGRNGLAQNSSSWGGSVVADDDGLFHLFYARFELGCGLSMWTNNSVCVHATAPSPLGPFVDADISLPVFCHGPKVVRASDGTWLLFHIGSAVDPVSRMCDCAANGGSEAACAPCPNPSGRDPGDGRGFVTFAHARDPAGPWTPWGAPVLEPAGGWEGWLSNPSPWPRADGSILLAFRAVASNSSPGGELGNVEMVGLAVAPAWNATYERVVATPIAKGEDPMVYVDTRGNGHVLTHPNCGHGHSFARGPALTDWIAAPEAVTCTFAWVNGTVVTVARRERPHLYFDAGGVPRVLYSGVEVHERAVTDASFTLAARVLAG
jgi:hypothetical protein